MINKTIGELQVTESITDPTGTTYTSLDGGGGSGGSGGVGWSHNGRVGAEDDVILALHEVPAGNSWGPQIVTAIAASGLALPSETQIEVGHLDSGGGFSDGNIILFGNGSSRYIENDVSTEWTNNTGGTATGAVLFRNFQSIETSVFTSGVF